MRAFVLACAAGLFLMGCGGTTADGGDSGSGNDSGTPVEASDDATTDLDAAAAYPADHTPMPLVDYNGGRILINPSIVTVTFASDNATTVGRVQELDDTIATGDYWTAITSEYCDSTKACIGKGTNGGHVVIQTPPASSYTDSSQGAASSLQDFIKLHVSGDGTDPDAGGFAPDFPTPDDNTLYVIYFPPGVQITLDGEIGCQQSWLAYHNTVVVPHTNTLPSATPYAIIPRCGTKESTTTESASHEIAEATTDPDIGLGSLAYYMVKNQLWASGGGEVGDLCTGKNTIIGDNFTVQRMWSNKSAAAGNDPCVPIPDGEIYFNSAPRQSKIILPKVGSTAVVDIDGYSTAPTPPWTVNAVDYGAFQSGTNSLSFAFDSTSLQNGGHIQLTVTLVAAMQQGQDEFSISSKDSSGTRHSWPVLAAAK